MGFVSLAANLGAGMGNATVSVGDTLGWVNTVISWSTVGTALGFLLSGAAVTFALLTTAFTGRWVFFGRLWLTGVPAQETAYLSPAFVTLFAIVPVEDSFWRKDGLTKRGFPASWKCLPRPAFALGLCPETAKQAPASHSSSLRSGGCLLWVPPPSGCQLSTAHGELLRDFWQGNTTNGKWVSQVAMATTRLPKKDVKEAAK